MQDYVRQSGTDTIRTLRMGMNQGKGGAVQQGMLHARGQYLLMVDADGATQFDDLIKLERELIAISQRTGHGIAVGSRSHLERNAVATVCVCVSDTLCHFT